jgi:hypothetical protein
LDEIDPPKIIIDEYKGTRAFLLSGKKKGVH